MAPVASSSGAPARADVTVIDPGPVPRCGAGNDWIQAMSGGSSPPVAGGPGDDVGLWAVGLRCATVDQEKGVGMDRWEYKIADLTKVEKDIGEVGVRFVHAIALLKRRVQNG
jgi:hypothetical protein